jgi:serine/threonine-protein kinase
VLRVFDRELERTVALKVMHERDVADSAMRTRFIAEARVTAQLQHPGIVAVHDRGELADGRLWYTMKEVRGKTLREVIDEMHQSPSLSRRTPGPQGAEDRGEWSFRRVIDAFARLAQAVGYAHGMGVVHRDLKPDNLMVGEFGAVLVMDWGLARRIDSAEPASMNSPGMRPISSTQLTQHGDVLGTPAYMAPEQARGERDRHGPATDVWALGAILHHLLSGAPPYRGSPQSVWRQIAAGARPFPLPETVSRQLARVCQRAMAAAVEDRHPDADRFSHDLFEWLDGAKRREHAIAVLAEGRTHRESADEHARKAEELERSAREALRDVRPSDPVERKVGAWRLEDRAKEELRDRAIAETRWIQAVSGALSVEPDLPEAHALLASYYRNRLIEAERAGHTTDAARFETLLRGHDRGENEAFLRGEGALTLLTDPPGAEVFIDQYVEVDRRLVLEPRGTLGKTPIDTRTLTRGSYLLRIRAEGRSEVRYPVLIERGEHWHGIPPNDSTPYAIPLPREGELGEDDCYVPAGWCWLGGDALATAGLPAQRLWVDGFVLRRYPITNAEYLEFLNDLVATGRSDEAELAVPRAPIGISDRRGERPPFERTPHGFALGQGFDGTWSPEWPVVMITWKAADLFAQWHASRSQRPWRLAHELEREKATRGVDARLMSWGNHLDPVMTWVLESARGDGDLARRPVADFRSDEGPYGVRGLCGGTRDFCLNVYLPEGPRLSNGRPTLVAPSEADGGYRVVRGGAWSSPLEQARAASRFALKSDLNRSTVGGRVARSFP